MERRNLIIIGIAVVFGLFAVFLANTWFSGMEQQQDVATQPQATTRIAVASIDMPFGTALTSDNIRLVNWPSDSVPHGAYLEADAERLMASGNVSIRPIAQGEPILLSRVSERAVLSANIPAEMRAVTVPVDAVSGVAGFITPGDTVDVLLTRQIPGDGANSDDQMTSVVLQGAQVLAVDLRSSEQDTDAAESSTATLLVFPEDAQKIALATQVGRVSLSLRNAEDQTSASRRVVTARDRDLSGGLYIPDRRRTGASTTQSSAAPAAATAAPVRVTETISLPRRPAGPSMTVIRGTESTLEEVQRYGS